MTKLPSLCRGVLPHLLLFCSLTVYAQVNVVTQHYDQGRTGWYNRENQLTKSNIGLGSFGRIFSRPVDDQLYAQPLIVQGVDLGISGKKNIVYLATVNNSVYAYDADSPKVALPYWQVNLTPPGQRPVTQQDLTGACPGNFQSNIGIVGTPVIDTLSGTLLLVARSIQPATTVFSEYLHALDIHTGKERPGSPVLVQASVSGSGDGNLNGLVSLDPQKNNQRTGLLLLNGTVYLGFSSHCDWGPYHGWVLGYDARTLRQQFVYNDTPDGYNGGIWMSGTGIAADSAGNIYFSTGNGSVGVGSDPANPRNRSESLLRLNPADSLQPVKDFFTPNNFPDLEASDLDLGTSGVMILPGSARALTACKDGNIYLVDQNNLGGYHSGGNQNLQAINLGVNANMHAQFTYYGGTGHQYAFFWPENTALKAIPFDRSTGLFDPQHIITSGVQGPVGQTGSMMSVSSLGNLDSTAILWASHPVNCDGENNNCPGILRAFDATDVTRELWNSSTLSTDNPGNFAKFSSPVIANGKVYLGTFSNQLVVYGLIHSVPDTCHAVNVAMGRPAYASSVLNNLHPPSGAFDGLVSTGWLSAPADPQYIYAYLGSRYDLCGVHLLWDSAYAKDFLIQVADDTLSWVTLAHITGNTSMSNQIPLQGTGRYVRMVGEQRAASAGYALLEMEVYGSLSSLQCPAPSGLAAKNIYENEATLQWDAAGADSFLVRYKTASDTGWQTRGCLGKQLTLTGLICGTDYYYSVQAVCADGSVSLATASAAFSTLSCNSHCGLLPSGWSSQDIGQTALEGAACYDGGVYSLRASGSDIWDLADQFHFAYAALQGDGYLLMEVRALDGANPWNKFGLMFRESLDPASRHAMIALTSGNGAAFQYRQSTGGVSYNTNQTGLAAPYWLKLVKNGTLYSGFAGQDTLHWTPIGNPTDLGFGASSPVYAGLALSSHDNTQISVGQAGNFRSLGFTDFELLHFSGELMGPQLVKLSWTTSREQNTAYFIVEKSPDDLVFSPMDTVAASGNGRYMVTYVAYDSNPSVPVSYYRLRMVDILGNFTYSPLVVIHNTDSKAPLLFPNPASAVVHVLQGADPVETIQIYDLTGRRLQVIQNTGGLQELTLPLNNLPRAVYVVEIRTSGGLFRKKLVKR